jgi:hypothetical protein
LAKDPQPISGLRMLIKVSLKDSYSYVLNVSARERERKTLSELKALRHGTIIYNGYTEVSRRSPAKCFRILELDGEGEGVEFKRHRRPLRLTAMLMMMILHAENAVASQRAVHETLVKRQLWWRT